MAAGDLGHTHAPRHGKRSRTSVARTALALGLFHHRQTGRNPVELQSCRASGDDRACGSRMGRAHCLLADGTVGRYEALNVSARVAGYVATSAPASLPL